MNLMDPHDRFNIANIVTFANVACGVMAMYFVTQHMFLPAIILAWIAGGFDILDGKLARKYKLSTEFGVQLDSFADFLSFVIMPAFLLFYSLYLTGWFSILVIGGVFIYYIISGLRRLVEFNLKTDAGSVDKYFTGVPTPLGAILLWVLYLIHSFGIISSPWIIAILAGVVAWSLNSNMKIKHP